MAKRTSTIGFDPERPVCREGIVSTELKNGMVFIRHPKFSSQVINHESWAFLQMCNGRSLEELNEQIAKSLGFRLTLDQLRSSLKEFAAGGLFEGSSPMIRNYRLLNDSALLKRLSPLTRPLTTRWFACVSAVASRCQSPRLPNTCPTRRMRWRSAARCICWSAPGSSNAIIGKAAGRIRRA